MPDIADAVLAVAEELEDPGAVRLREGGKANEGIHREHGFTGMVVQGVHADILTSVRQTRT